MKHTPSRGRSLAAAIAVVVALFAPMISVAPATATAGYVGSMSGDFWDDYTLAPMMTGVPYSSTLTLPPTNGPWGDVIAQNLPAGLSFEVSGDIVTVTGTPTQSGLVDDFQFAASGGDGAQTQLSFSEVYIDPGLAATETTVDTNGIGWWYTGLNLVVHVTGDSPTGTVTFSILGTTIGTSLLSDGAATFTGAVSDAYIGSNVTVTATYEGDSRNAASSGDGFLYIYAPTATMSGSVWRNGSLYSTTVELVNGSTGLVVDTTTSTGGAYSFHFDDIDTPEESGTPYYVRVRYEGDYIYYTHLGGPGVDSYSHLGSLMPVAWRDGLDIYINVRLIWSDTDLAAPQQGTAYSDEVRAGGGAGTKHYIVTSGSLPDGLTLDELTGEVHGTPTSQDSATFTITVSNPYNSTSQEFTLQPTAPVVAPGALTGTMTQSYNDSWTSNWVDGTISDDFTVGVYYEETLTLPTPRPWTFYDSDDALSSLPPGLTVEFPGDGDYNGSGEVVLKGTPTVASASTKIVLAFNSYSGSEMWLTFDPIVIKKAPTTTSPGDDTYWKYDSVHLNATVSPGDATGTVEFFLGATSIGTRPVSSGSANFDGAIPESFVGQSPVVTAVYSGDANHASSVSTSEPILYVYGDRIVHGKLLRNGLPIVGEPVRLLTSTYALAGATDTTDASGEFQLDVGEPPSFYSAMAGYAIEAPNLGLYYSSTHSLFEANTSFIGDATVLYEADWATVRTFYVNIPPTWTDDALAQPRLGSAYSDSVTATTIGASPAITYTVTGDVPGWLTFNAGTFTATNPTDQDPHTFMVTATSSYRATSREFTLTAQDAVVPPSFTDDTVATPQAGVLLDDQVLATGTGPITYAVTSGSLPAWMTLGASTGLITGTPPLSASGDAYSFTVTATGYGTDSALIVGTVAAAPAVALELNFEVGDVAAGSTFDFEVTGAGDAVDYSVTINSVPFVAASGLTSGLGSASGTAAIQSAIGTGSHSIVLLTYASDGTPRTATAWFSVLADGTIGEISLTGPVIGGAGLAFTGSSPGGALGAALLLLLGGYLALRRARAVRVP